MTQTLSRELEQYSVLSSSAVAAKQLMAKGKILKRGQRIRFIYIAPGPGVHAWDLPNPPDIKIVDRTRYRELLIRATQEVLQPLGVTETILKDWLISRAAYLAPPGLLPHRDPERIAVPLLADVRHLCLGSS